MVIISAVRRNEGESKLTLICDRVPEDQKMARYPVTPVSSNIPENPQRTENIGPWARRAYLVVGLFFTGIGLLGAILPVFPSTVFFLIAIWAFSRSSPRLHNWLWSHPIFGPPIRDWFEYGSISPWAKVAALALIVSSFAVTAYVLWGRFWILVPVFLILSAVSTFIVTRPNPPR